MEEGYIEGPRLNEDNLDKIAFLELRLDYYKEMLKTEASLDTEYKIFILNEYLETGETNYKKMAEKAKKNFGNLYGGTWTNAALEIDKLITEK